MRVELLGWVVGWVFGCVVVDGVSVGVEADKMIILNIVLTRFSIRAGRPYTGLKRRGSFVTATTKDFLPLLQEETKYSPQHPRSLEALWSCLESAQL